MLNSIKNILSFNLTSRKSDVLCEVNYDRVDGGKIEVRLKSNSFTAMKRTMEDANNTSHSLKIRDDIKYKGEIDEEGKVTSITVIKETTFGDISRMISLNPGTYKIDSYFSTGNKEEFVIVLNKEDFMIHQVMDYYDFGNIGIEETVSAIDSGVEFLETTQDASKEYTNYKRVLSLISKISIPEFIDTNLDTIESLYSNGFDIIGDNGIDTFLEDNGIDISKIQNMERPVKKNKFKTFLVNVELDDKGCERLEESLTYDNIQFLLSLSDFIDGNRGRKYIRLDRSSVKEILRLKKFTDIVILDQDYYSSVNLKEPSISIEFLKKNKEEAIKYRDEILDHLIEMYNSQYPTMADLMFEFAELIRTGMIAGGFIRDKFLGKQGKDMDIFLVRKSTIQRIKEILDIIHHDETEWDASGEANVPIKTETDEGITYLASSHYSFWQPKRSTYVSYRIVSVGNNIKITMENINEFQGEGGMTGLDTNKYILDLVLKDSMEAEYPELSDKQLYSKVLNHFDFTCNAIGVLFNERLSPYSRFWEESLFSDKNKDFDSQFSDNYITTESYPQNIILSDILTKNLRILNLFKDGRISKSSLYARLAHLKSKGFKISEEEMYKFNYL